MFVCLFKMMVGCHKVVLSALTVCLLSGLRASSMLVKGSAFSFHTTLNNNSEKDLGKIV